MPDPTPNPKDERIKDLEKKVLQSKEGGRQEVARVKAEFEKYKLDMAARLKQDEGDKDRVQDELRTRAKLIENAKAEKTQEISDLKTRVETLEAQNKELAEENDRLKQLVAPTQ